MARRPAPPEPPPPGPEAGASASLEEPVAPAVAASPEEPESTSPETPSDPPPPALRSYLVGWRFEGFRERPLAAGDLVDATEEEAAPFLAPNGPLSPVV